MESKINWKLATDKAKTWPKDTYRQVLVYDHVKGQYHISDGRCAMQAGFLWTYLPQKPRITT